MSVVAGWISFSIRLLVLAAIVFKSLKDKSLTKSGIITAVITGLIHSVPESWMYLILLLEFFILGNKATKYKHTQKIGLTQSEINSEKSGENTELSRNHIQVLANSLTATLSILLYILLKNYSHANRLCQTGVIIHYCCVTSDTWSSEIGILSKSDPILLSLNPNKMFKTVPRGTNGGVSKLGLAAAGTGSLIISLSACLAFLSFSSFTSLLSHCFFFTISGFTGSLIDSLLGSYLQASYYDTKSSKIVEVTGGFKMLNPKKSRSFVKIVNGSDILDNNQVNLFMSIITTCIFVIIYFFLFI